MYRLKLNEKPPKTVQTYNSTYKVEQIILESLHKHSIVN